MAELRQFMFDRVYLGPEATREHAKIHRVVRSLFDHYCDQPEEIPASIPRWAARAPRHGLHRGDDRPVLHPGVRGAEPCRSRSRRDALRADSRDSAFARRSTCSRSSRARTELRRAGASEWVGLCPFHDERTPSFGVNPDDKVYHCFGCEASGDAFTFLMETEGLDFTGALETLADRFGVQLETEAEDPQSAARRQRRERLQSLLGRAADYYARYLWESTEAARAREYLLGRGLDRADLARVPGRLRAERLGPHADRVSACRVQR